MRPAFALRCAAIKLRCSWPNARRSAATSSTRITPGDLERLAARIDPMDVFRPSAVIGFAVDQILTEKHGR